MNQNENTMVKISINYNPKRHQKRKSLTKKQKKMYILTKNLKNNKLNKKLDAKKTGLFLVK